MSQELTQKIEQAARIKAAQREMEALKRQKAIDDLLAPYLAHQPKEDVLNSIQFKHNTWAGVTYAVVAPEGRLLSMMADQLALTGKAGEIPVQIGMSFVNAEEGDTYNKKVGRVISAAKIKTLQASLTSYFVDGERAHFTLKAGSIELSYILSHGKENPFLLRIDDSRVYRRHRKMRRGR